MNRHAALSALFAAAPQVGVRGVFQLVFAPNDATWVEVKEKVTVAQGWHPAANTTIEIAEGDFFNVAVGAENIEQLFAGGRIRISGDMGLATLLPQILEGGAATDTNAAVAADPNHRYPAPARLSEAISMRSKPIHSIERRPYDGLSAIEFKSRYLPSGTPVILSSALNEWPLFGLSREDAVAQFEGLQGISRHGDYVSKTFSTERDFRTQSMSSFIASLEQHPIQGGEPAAYMGNNIVPSQLIEQIRYPPYFDRAQYIHPRIWIGPTGTLTPLHRDDCDNLFAQVWGRKSFILAAPHHREALGTWSTSPQGGLDGCEFNPDAPDYTLYPGARNVPFLRITLEAGDLLFLPEGWFHQVRSITTSLSVNFWINSGRGW